VNNPAVGVKLIDDPQERAECKDRGDCLSRWPRPAGTMLPLATVSETPNGPPVGYVLPFAEGDPLGLILNPAARAGIRRALDFRDLVGIAANVAENMAANHDELLTECDVNAGNKLVGRTRVNGRYPTFTIDTDSFAFRGTTKDGRLVEFRCPVGQEEYTAPEAAGQNYGNVDRDERSDAFGLAVLIWMLVKNGSHPFAWRHFGSGSIPSIGEIIKNRQWPFAPKTPLPQGVQPLDAGIPFRTLPTNIQDYFTRAFTGEPADRPTAEEWAEVLTEFERQLPKGGTAPYPHAPRASSPVAAARAFVNALAQLANAANVLRAVRRLLKGTQVSPHQRAASKSPRLKRRSLWLVLVALVLLATTALVTQVLPPATPPANPPKATDPVSPPPPGRFAGIPLWDELDNEIQSERRKP
jgi:DNA-binding helix-hairpin-helix protein with protein kinase domain